MTEPGTPSIRRRLREMRTAVLPVTRSSVYMLGSASSLWGSGMVAHTWSPAFALTVAIGRLRDHFGAVVLAGSALGAANKGGISGGWTDAKVVPSPLRFAWIGAPSAHALPMSEQAPSAAVTMPRVTA